MVNYVKKYIKKRSLKKFNRNKKKKTRTKTKNRTRKYKTRRYRRKSMRGGSEWVRYGPNWKNIKELALLQMKYKFDENWNKWGDSEAVHLVCGLAGEFCVLDTAINLSLHFPHSTVYFLENYTQYAAFGLFPDLPIDIIMGNLNKRKDAKNKYGNLTFQSFKSENDCFKFIEGKKRTQIYLWVIDMQQDFCPSTITETGKKGSFAVHYSQPLYEGFEDRNTKVKLFKSDTTSLDISTGEHVNDTDTDTDTILITDTVTNRVKLLINKPTLTELWNSNKFSIPRLITQLSNAGLNCDIILSRDGHTKAHCSFHEDEDYGNLQKPGGLYPPHCVRGTQGELIMDSIKKASLEYYNKKNKINVILKGCTQRTDSYSAIPYHINYPDINKRAPIMDKSKVTCLPFTDSQLKSYIFKTINSDGDKKYLTDNTDKFDEFKDPEFNDISISK